MLVGSECVPPERDKHYDKADQSDDKHGLRDAVKFFHQKIPFGLLPQILPPIAIINLQRRGCKTRAVKNGEARGCRHVP
jgi:hypothetical protein